MANEIEKILKILIENQEEKFSIRKLSILRKINYKSAHNAIIKLEKEGIIKPEKFGNAINCSFNKKFNPLVFKVEHERREKLLKNKDFKILYSKLNKLKFPFIALLFGSRVKKYNRHSDIDLLILGEGGMEIEQTISLMPLKIHLTNISPREFLNMAKSKEFSVVSEAIKKNIILIGIEDYYRLLEDAR
ncbi:MAG: Nucleotidyltransferase family protein [archaeon GW2011_AR20]|nr:MAG: Nucleotidyltransferase family protein [archaeon GW2011_AR20]AQS28119.1 hypothetical protein [uncultured archaeon]AQS28719.1 hypothetical protein [uncultured archaeon]MBS3160585.1 hypothetical protein [Candidatus Woesearchaeota archaeon]